MPVAVLIGMMGAGKTRVGKEVAHIMNLPFADADVCIEREVGMSIPEFFEREGEPEFRKVEADLIADMLVRISKLLRHDFFRDFSEGISMDENTL